MVLSTMSLSHNPQKCALLVLSCDAYEDLWVPFFHLLQKHWPDQPFPLFLGAEAKTFRHPNVTTLHSSAGRGNWTGCLLDYLAVLPHDNVLLMLDDFFLRRRVDSAQVTACLTFAQQMQAIQVRLIPQPRPTRRIIGNDLVGEAECGSPYRLSTQAAIWNRQALRSLLVPGESPWEFEHQGNVRAGSHASGFYATWKAVLPYRGFLSHHVVEKGRWLPHEKWIFRRQNIGCDFTRRPTLGTTQVLLYHAAQLTDKSLDIFPWRLKTRLKKILKRVLHPLLGNHYLRMNGSRQPSSRPPALK
jgi:hypothetical protein